MENYESYLKSLRLSKPSDYEFLVSSDSLEAKLKRRSRNPEVDIDEKRNIFRMTRVTLNLSHCLSSLTKRQLEIYRLNIEQGYAPKVIARILGLSRSTIHEHLHAIRRKAIRSIKVK